QIFTGSEAVVHLDAIQVFEVGVGAAQRVEYGGAHVRHHVRGQVSSGGAVEFLLQAQPDRPMVPAGDAGDRSRGGMLAQVGVGDQDDARAAVGHLTAVEPPQPALDERVGVVV